MSFFGTGGEDWVELDVDLFDRERLGELRRWLDDAAPRLEAWLGSDYDIDIDAVGHAVVFVGNQPRYRVEIGNAGRVVFTAIPDPEGPL